LELVLLHLIAEEDATGLVRGVVHPGVAREVDNGALVGKRKAEGDQEELEEVIVVYNDGTHNTEVFGHIKGQVELYVLLRGKVWHFQPVRNLQTWASQTFSCLCKDTKRFPRTSLPPIVLKILRR
jgi:hypothetical protein